MLLTLFQFDITTFLRLRVCVGVLSPYHYSLHFTSNHGIGMSSYSILIHMHWLVPYVLTSGLRLLTGPAQATNSSTGWTDINCGWSHCLVAVYGLCCCFLLLCFRCAAPAVPFVVPAVHTRDIFHISLFVFRGSHTQPWPVCISSNCLII